MAQLRNAPTRKLNAFEQASLELLRNGEELAFAEQPNRLLALGSLRAQAACLECHSVSRGMLLGAFSYEFHRKQ
jgi:hypothetical protein